MEVVFNAGEKGAHFYVLQEGSFSCRIQERKGGLKKKKENVHLYQRTAWGTYPSFGEMAILGKSGRQATVKARSDGSLWRLHRDDYMRIKAKRSSQDDGGFGIEQVEEEGYVVPRKEIIPSKDPLTIQMLEASMSKSLLFAQLRPDQRRSIIDLMEEQRFRPGDIVYRQAEYGHRFYVVSKGDFEVMVSRETGSEPHCVHHYTGGIHPNQPWAIFGEQALLFRKPRGSTVRAVMESTCYVLHRQTFKAAVQQMFSYLKKN